MEDTNSNLPFSKEDFDITSKILINKIESEGKKLYLVQSQLVFDFFEARKNNFSKMMDIIFWLSSFVILVVFLAGCYMVSKYINFDTDFKNIIANNFFSLTLATFTTIFWNKLYEEHQKEKLEFNLCIEEEKANKLLEVVKSNLELIEQKKELAILILSLKLNQSKD